MDTTADLVVVVPMLRRPHRVEPFLRSLYGGTPEPFRLIFVCSANDAATLAACQHHAATLATVSVEVMPPRARGDYAAKINHAIAISEEPFIFAGADDLHFHAGWWPAARARFDDPAIGVVGTQDLANARTIAGEHSTHLVFRREYVDKSGTIDDPGLAFHPGYWHEYVDDEAVETAKFRGAWAFADDSVVEHLHPMVGKAKRDRIYDAQRTRMRIGEALIEHRRHMWTPPGPRPTPANTAIIVATYGDPAWHELAEARAIPSARAQKSAELITIHGRTLAGARNAAASQATAEWLCFLDADDELEPGYLEAMADTTGDLLAPAIRYVEGKPGIPELPAITYEDRDIMRLNPCVIGTLIRRDLFEDIGGFWTERAFEDWSLFRRAVLAGARLEHVPAAVYRCHINSTGRNSTVTNADGLMRQIIASHNTWKRKRRARR